MTESQPGWPGAPNAWFAYVKPRRRPRVRLFCLPYAGGGASAYRDWADELAEEIEVVPIQIPGRENRFIEPAIRDMASLVGQLTRPISSRLDLPFAIFGHSLGAAIGHALACHLVSLGQGQPVHLLISSRRAPGAPSGPLHASDDEGLHGFLTSFGGTPNEVLENEELMELILPTLRADLELDDGYLPATARRLDCPVTAFVGTSDETVSPSEVKEWRRVSRGRFELREMSGGHFYLIDQRQELLASIEQTLLGPDAP